MSVRVLVTGGHGFIGSALVRALVNRGYRVRTLDNDSRGSSTNLGDLASAVELLTGDIRDSGVVMQACRGMDAVCHLAAINGTKNFYERPDLVLEVGVKGAVNIIDAVNQERCELFVVSTSEVYQSAAQIPTDETVPLIIPDPRNRRFSYGASKIISEMLALHASRAKRTCIIRPHNVYGPNMGFDHVIPEFIQRMISKLDEESIVFPIQGKGDETRAFCFIDDFIDGFLYVFDRGVDREIYHVGTEEETSIRHLAELIGRYFGKRLAVTPSPLTEGSTSRRCPDITKLRELGFRPKTSLEAGLVKTIPWYERFDSNSKRSPNEIRAAAGR